MSIPNTESRLCVCVRFSLERLVKADGGGAVEDDVDAGGELLHVLWADGEAGLRQLAADRDDLLMEIRVLLPHSVEKLPDKDTDGGSHMKEWACFTLKD